MSRRVASLLVCALAAPAALSAPTGYVLHSNMTIYSVDAATNAETFHSGTIFQSESLAVGPSGTLYSADGLGVIWQVGGPFIPVGPTTYTTIGDLDYGGGGLWGFDNFTQDLFFFDLGTGLVTYSQTIAGLLGATVTGVAHHTTSGDVFLSGNTGMNSDFLFRIPSFATSATLVGQIIHGDQFSNVSDIDFDSAGNLYAMTWFHRWFYTVDLNTAAATFVSAGPHRDAVGLALAPTVVPAPAAPLAFGLALLARRRRR